MFFDDFFTDLGASGIFTEKTSEGTNVYIDLPGVVKGDVDLSINHGVVSVKATRKGPVSRTYNKAFRISDAVNAGGILANLENGVLTLLLPTTEAAKPKQIIVS